MKGFEDFLMMAKKATYASEGDDASVQPLLSGSKQLEYEFGNFHYRDTYFGSVFFVGQEVVYYKGKPYWSMSYSGGLLDSANGKNSVKEVYSFLRKNLTLVENEFPVRGPDEYKLNRYEYVNAHSGSLNRFYGEEQITRDSELVYDLRYSGGILL